MFQAMEFASKQSSHPSPKITTRKSSPLSAKVPFHQPIFLGGNMSFRNSLAPHFGKENYEITKFESPKHLVERSTRVVPDQPPMTAGGCLA